MIEIKEIRSIEKLDLLAKKIVEGYLLGLHRSPFHGFSAEFREHKQYNEGDNLKNIDYKVYARTDKLFVKKFDEETNLKCQLVLDISNSMYYPVDTRINKMNFSVIAIASLMILLKKQRDAFGLTLFADDIIHTIEPKLTIKTKQIIYSKLAQVMDHPQNQKKSNIITCMDKLAYSLPKRSMVVIFTDFIDAIGEDDFEMKFNKAIQHLIFLKHDIIFFYVYDKKTEVDFIYPDMPHEFIDLESGEKLKLNPQELRTGYYNYMVSKMEFLEKKCIQFGIDLVKIDIDGNYDSILSAFLRKRKIKR